MHIGHVGILGWPRTRNPFVSGTFVLLPKSP